MNKLDDRILRFLAGLDLRKHPREIQSVRESFVRAATVDVHEGVCTRVQIFERDRALGVLAMLNLQYHSIAEQRELAAIVHEIRADAQRLAAAAAKAKWTVDFGPTSPTDILAELSQSEAFRNLAKRLQERLQERSAPAIAKRGLQRWRDWYLTFDLDGMKGEVKPVSKCPSVHFRGQKLIAADNLGGGATRIVAVSIGSKRFPIGQLSSSFAHDALSSGIAFPVCEKALHITFEIEFLEDAHWEGMLFGKAAT